MPLPQRGGATRGRFHEGQARCGAPASPPECCPRPGPAPGPAAAIRRWARSISSPPCLVPSPPQLRGAGGGGGLRLGPEGPGGDPSRARAAAPAPVPPCPGAPGSDPPRAPGRLQRRPRRRKSRHRDDRAGGKTSDDIEVKDRGAAATGAQRVQPYRAPGMRGQD